MQVFSLDGNNSMGFARNSVGLPTLMNNNALSAISTFTYTTDFNQLASMTDADGNLTKIGYTVLGDPQTVTDAANNVTTATYTSDGLVASVTNALNQQTVLTYDPATRNPLTITDPLNKVTSFTNTAAGYVETVTDPLLRVSRAVYDSRGRMTEAHDPSGGVTKYTLDGVRNVLDIEDPLLHHTTLTYYPGNLPATSQSAEGQIRTLFYDASGALSMAVNARGQAIKYYFDAAHQVLKKFLPGDEVDVTYTSLGLPTTLEDADSKLATGYDVAGRVTSQQTFDKGHQPAVTLGFQLDKIDNRLQLTDPAGTQTYVPNALNLIQSITNPTGVQITMGFDVLNRRNSFTRPNGINTTITFDPAGHLDTMTHGPIGNPLGRFHFGVDNDGNRTSLDDLITLTGGTVQSGMHSFGYDILNQMNSATHPAAEAFNPAEAFQFDNVGNRTNTSEIYDRVYRLQQNANFAFQWDADGNMTQKVRNSDGYAWQFVWDVENQLTEVDIFANGLPQPRTSQVLYRYDPMGRRIEKSVDGVITRYVYDGRSILLEYDGSNTLQARYTQGPDIDQPLVVRRGGQDYFFHQDGTNSVRMITNATGQVVHTQDFSSFGKLVQETGVRVAPYAFTGREYDPESGLHFYRARYYDPGIGRFLSEDPVGGLNPYTYVGNSPVNNWDPMGLRYGKVGLTLVTMVPGLGPKFLDVNDNLKAGKIDAANQGMLDIAGDVGLLAATVALPEVAPFLLEGGEAAGVIEGAEAVAMEGAESASQFAKLRASLAAEEIEGAQAVGSALKSDPFHRAASFVVDDAAENGSVFTIGGRTGPANLTQVPGGLNGVPGRFEWIVDAQGNLTHQRFVPGGAINGIPNIP